MGSKRPRKRGANGTSLLTLPVTLTQLISISVQNLYRRIYSHLQTPNMSRRRHQSSKTSPQLLCKGHGQGCSKLCHKNPYKPRIHKQVSHPSIRSYHISHTKTHLFHDRCQPILSRLTRAHLWSQAQRRKHHAPRGMGVMHQKVYLTTCHRREPPRRPPYRTRVGISPTRLSRPPHGTNAPTCTITHGVMIVRP